MSTYPELVYWLTFINESGLKLNIIKPIIQQWCVIEQRPLAELFPLSPLEWATTFGLTESEAEQVQRLPDQLAQQASQLKAWQKQGIEPLIFTDPRYPQRLLHQLPPAKQPLMLWVQGAISLLNEANVSILSNQTIHPPLQHFLTELSELLINQRISLISGYGRGFERDLFELMFQQSDSKAITILPMGLAAFHQTTPKLTHAQNSDRLLLVSPFTPDTPYQEKLASARNMLIDHLAFATLVIQPDLEIQTRAQSAIERGSSVFVYTLNETPPTQALMDAGALPLTELNELVEMVQQSMIDAVMLIPDPTPPTPATLPEIASDQYILPQEALEPLDPQETLRLLATNGQLPTTLRERLS